MQQKIEKQEEIIQAWKTKAEAIEKASAEARRFVSNVEYAKKYVKDQDPVKWAMGQKIDRQRQAIQDLHRRLGDDQNLPGAEHPKQPGTWTITEDGFAEDMRNRARQKRLKISTDPDGRPYFLEED